MKGDDALAAVPLQLSSGRVTTMRELLDGWSGHVHRLKGEHSSHLSDLQSAWGVYDYYATLLTRSRVEEALPELPSPYSAAATAEMEAIDEVFRSFTRDDVDRDFERFISLTFNEVPPDEGWWWRRIPVSGPVIEELADILSRLDRSDGFG